MKMWKGKRGGVKKILGRIRQLKKGRKVASKNISQPPTRAAGRAKGRNFVPPMGLGGTKTHPTQLASLSRALWERGWRKF